MLDVATLLHATAARPVRLVGAGRPASEGLVAADLQQPFGGVSIDSRSMPPAGLFIALPGQRADGHDYVDDALAAGALGCLVSRVPDTHALQSAIEAGQATERSADRRPTSCYLFVVPDPLEALHRLASSWRARHRAEIVGITGSIGKTTTKEILASVLSQQMTVLKSEANYNTEIGLPLVLLRLAPQHDAAVLEMGMYAAGDIALLAKIARPRIGVVTNVAPIHLERMGTIERIARAKSELVAALPPEGQAILNGDDPWTRAMAQAAGVAPVLLVGQGPGCDYRATEIVSHGLDGTSFLLEAEGRRTSFRTHVPGRHTVNAFLAAIAVARSLQMEWDAIQEAVERTRLSARQRILQVGEPAGGIIIDDSYNASPLSMGAALELLRSSPGIRIAVLADMLELGPFEEEAHRQVGNRAADAADWLVVRGPRSAWIAEEAEKHGMAADRVLRTGTNEDAVRTVRAITRNSPRTPTMQQARSEETIGWTVLVKGSRGMRMEEVVQGLRGDL